MSGSKGQIERFRATSGRLMGVLAVGLSVVLVGLGVAEARHGFAPWLTGVFALGGVLAWTSMLRPALWADGDSLVMRGMVSTTAIPLAAVESVLVRQTTSVRAGDKRYVSPVVGRSWRKLVRKPSPGERTAPGEVDYPSYVEDRISDLALAARERAGVSLMSDEQLELARGTTTTTDLAPAFALLAACLLVVVGLFL